MHPPETPSIGLPESTARHGSREGSTPRNRGRGKGRGRGGKGRGGGGEEGVEARRATPIGADGDATPEVAVEGEATMTGTPTATSMLCLLCDCFLPLVGLRYSTLMSPPKFKLP